MLVRILALAFFCLIAVCGAKAACGPKCVLCGAGDQCVECPNKFGLTPDGRDCHPCSSKLGRCTNCDGSPNKCTSCSPGYGLKKSGACKRCATENCAQCGDDYRRCTNCAKPYGLGPRGECRACKVKGCTSCTWDYARCGSCVAGQGVVQGRGPSGGQDSCTPCRDPNCLNCKYKHDMCMKCRPGFGLTDGIQASLQMCTETCGAGGTCMH